MILFSNPSIELLPKLRDILHIGNGNQRQKDIHFPAEPYQVTVLSSLAKTDPAAQYNYEHFIRTMAKMVQKYADKII